MIDVVEFKKGMESIEKSALLNDIWQGIRHPINSMAGAYRQYIRPELQEIAKPGVSAGVQAWANKPGNVSGEIQKAVPGLLGQAGDYIMNGIKNHPILAGLGAGGLALGGGMALSHLFSGNGQSQQQPQQPMVNPATGQANRRAFAFDKPPISA